MDASPRSFILEHFMHPFPLARLYTLAGHSLPHLPQTHQAS